MATAWPGSEQFTNNAQSTLSSSITDSETGITVASAASFPADGLFRIIIDSEIMLVTKRASNTFTVIRGTENTSAVSHSSGAVVTQILSKEGVYNAFGVDVVNVKLSLDSSTPNKVNSSGTILYALPFNGNKLSLFNTDDNDWRNAPIPTAGVSVSLSACSPSSVYDCFAYYSVALTGVQLELASWYSNTVRSTGTPTIVQQDGRWVKTSDKSRRLLGSVLTYPTGFAFDIQKNRFLSNIYNQVPRELYHPFSFTSYTLTSTPSGQPVNNDAQNQVEYLISVSGTSPVRCQVTNFVFATVSPPVSPSYFYTLGFSVDNGGVPNSRIIGATYPYFAVAQLIGAHEDSQPEGYHYLRPIEICNSDVTISSFGDAPIYYRGGIYGELHS